MADKKLMHTIEQIIDSNRTSEFFRNFEGGPHVRVFEKAFADYVGVKYAVSVCNGTLALACAYEALQCQSGWVEGVAEAVVSPLTFVSTVSELVRTRWVPVFADVDPHTWAISPEAIEKACTRKTSMIVAMDPLGISADMNAIREIAVKHGKTSCVPGGKLLVVEDAAQAIGSTFDGVPCGSRADIATFSLQATKSVTCGEGGVCVTNNEEYYQRLLHIRNSGNKYGPFKERYSHIIATNYRLTEIGAAIATHSLKEFERTGLKAQIERAKILAEAMDKNRLFTQQGRPLTEWTTEGNGYIIGSTLPTPEMRDRFLKKAKRFNRGEPGYVVGAGYSETVSQLPAFRRWATTPCSVAEDLVTRFSWFDVRAMPMSTVKDLARVVEKFRQ